MLALDADPTAGNRRALEATLDALDTLEPKNPYGTFYRAYLLFKDNRPTQAAARASEILAREDVTPAVRAWVLRHRAYIKAEALGDRDGALRDLEEALVLDPASARTFHILAETLLGVGRAEEALTRSRQAVALMPSYWRNQQTLGLALSALGQADAASEAFAAACRLGETQSACALHAIALIRGGKRAEATAAATHAAQLTEDPTGVYNLACYWALEGDRKKAIAYLKRSLDIGFAGTRPADDPDLVSLRDDAEFRAIVAGWRTVAPGLPRP
jgi:tetratricopeptide (TPR) repeat protein